METIEREAQVEFLSLPASPAHLTGVSMFLSDGGFDGRGSKASKGLHL
jgi:hypothetical protein